MQSIDSIETYSYGTSKDLVSEGKEIKRNNVIKQYKKENIKEHNTNWSQIPDHLYKILIIGGSGSGKTNLLFNLISKQPNIDNHLFRVATPPVKSSKVLYFEIAPLKSSKILYFLKNHTKTHLKSSIFFWFTDSKIIKICCMVSVCIENALICF